MIGRSDVWRRKVEKSYIKPAGTNTIGYYNDYTTTAKRSVNVICLSEIRSVNSELLLKITRWKGFERLVLSCLNFSRQIPFSFSSSETNLNIKYETACYVSVSQCVSNDLTPNCTPNNVIYTRVCVSASLCAYINSIHINLRISFLFASVTSIRVHTITGICYRFLEICSK